MSAGMGNAWIVTTKDPSKKDRDENDAVDDIIDFATAKGEADSPASDSDAPAPG